MHVVLIAFGILAAWSLLSVPVAILAGKMIKAGAREIPEAPEQEDGQ